MGQGHINLPMPWTEYRNLPDEDLKANFFAYLKPLNPVDNVVPAAVHSSRQFNLEPNRK